MSAIGEHFLSLTWNTCTHKLLSAILSVNIFINLSLQNNSNILINISDLLFVIGLILCYCVFLLQGPIAAPSLNPDAEVWTNPNFNLDVPGPAYPQTQQPWLQFPNDLTNHEGRWALPLSGPLNQNRHTVFYVFCDKEFVICSWTRQKQHCWMNVIV